MLIVLLAIGLLLLSGFLALLAGRNSRGANLLGGCGAFFCSLLGLIEAVQILASGRAEQIRWAWNVPYGSFFVRIDALSALFLIPIFILCAVCGLYGYGYMKSFRGRKNLGAYWFFFNGLAASMAMVAVAANGVLFLMSWELMALCSFFLVTFEHEDRSVQRAGWIYLAATHIGTAFLLVLFLLLGRQAGDGCLDFSAFFGSRGNMGGYADVVFLLAVIGFGSKAGFVPFHIWLPEAHPAAPSPVSAVMSGVMLKTGIYGILRILTFLGPAHPWWGYLLLSIGLVSGILGVLMAIAQHDLKRLLAYHSVENVGIIALGLGLGILGVVWHLPALAVLGFGGGLLHVINHALFKGLLFMGAGSVQHGTGTRQIDLLGGLIKRMPWTGATFLIGAVAICGLPPLNGFVSEFLIYRGGFHGVGLARSAAAGSVLIIGLALIGGLAAACFTKAFGVVFLGEPRSPHGADVHEAGLSMRIAMLLLAAGCVGIGLFSPWVVRLMGHAVAQCSAISYESAQSFLAPASSALLKVAVASGCFLLAVLLVYLLRAKNLSARTSSSEGTWDCGYFRPTARMQYTASSFAQPVTTMFEAILRTRSHTPSFGNPQGPPVFFPGPAVFESHTEDFFLKSVYAPIFTGVKKFALKFRFLQAGRVQFYILYIALTLFVLLIWCLR
ncbi:MAG: proton-conducting transporter membrane subunit [Syntrophobacteraceae bacterium]